MSGLRLATRASELALVQTRQVAARLESALGVETELVEIRTRGDELPGPLARHGGKGLFIAELEEALRDGRADLAVHSAKDLPARLPDGLALLAFPERADPRDALVVKGGAASLDELPRGARVGTGSLRRGAQLRARRADLEPVALRGNVPTRLRKLESEGLDALVLACAGLDRLGLTRHIRQRIAPEQMLPAVAQGTLALEGRAGDPRSARLAELDVAEVSIPARAERAVLAGLDADCTVPLAAYAELRGSELRLRALLASADGERLLRAQAAGDAARPEALGAQVAETLLADGGRELLAELAAEEGP